MCSSVVAVCMELSRGLQGLSLLLKKHVYGGFIKVINKQSLKAKEAVVCLRSKLVETDNLVSVRETHIHLRVVCEACKQSCKY